METFGNEPVAKNRKQYTCLNCDYNTCNKYDYEKHLNTIKHKNTTLETNGNVLETNFSKKSPKIATYVCSCGKKYIERSGLWKHKKKCEGEITDKDIMMALVKDSSELKKLIIKVIEKDTGNYNNSNNTNHSHNKTFNLNVYLNETCKDAINIDEFVKSIKIKMEDLENTGRQGYVEGVTNIIVNNLNSITTHQRPIHCTDEKREVLYIKSDGEWIKETDKKPILTNAIKTIANENIKAISEWQKEYPDCTKSDSKKNDLYLKIVSNSMSGCSKEECEKNYNKIIKNIVKETVINKDDC